MAGCRRRKKAKACIIVGCERPASRRGICEAHRTRLRRKKSLDAPVRCAREEHPDWPRLVGRFFPPCLVAFVDELAARRGLSRKDVLLEVLEEGATRHGYVGATPPPPAWVDEGVAELKEARRKVEESWKAFWRSAGVEPRPPERSSAAGGGDVLSTP